MILTNNILSNYYLILERKCGIHEYWALCVELQLTVSVIPIALMNGETLCNCRYPMHVKGQHISQIWDVCHCAELILSEGIMIDITH